MMPSIPLPFLPFHCPLSPWNVLLGLEVVLMTLEIRKQKGKCMIWLWYDMEVYWYDFSERKAVHEQRWQKSKCTSVLWTFVHLAEPIWRFVIAPYRYPAVVWNKVHTKQVCSSLDSCAGGIPRLKGTIYFVNIVSKQPFENIRCFLSIITFK